MAALHRDQRDVLRRQVGHCGCEPDGLDSVLQELQRQVGRDPDRRHEADRNVARMLQRSDSARAGGAGGIHPPGADLHPGGDWEVGLRGSAEVKIEGLCAVDLLNDGTVV